MKNVPFKKIAGKEAINIDQEVWAVGFYDLIKTLSSVILLKSEISFNNILTLVDPKYHSSIK